MKISRVKKIGGRPKIQTSSKYWQNLEFRIKTNSIKFAKKEWYGLNLLDKLHK
tara:strand:+ start:771 stop:929 length:159 start_codon:yes stop_codon:yes gene_type:complete